MSYPRHLQCLVIEDEIEAKVLYDEILDTLARDDQTILPPKYAFSKQEAEAALDAPSFYQVVILDLRLPLRSNVPPEDSVAVGLALLEHCQNRDAYPIPALLVVTAHAEKTEQSKLRDTLRESFAYGELIIKGGSLLDEIRRAIRNAHVYGDLGLHMHEAKDLRVPGLSPRDEDLLRRGAIRNNAIGVDLKWWSSEYSKPTGQFAAMKGWTKILMGYFLLGAGQGRSRPMFCKFMPAQQLDVVARDAQLLEQKLSHIKVKASIRSGDRSLLVTEKTGASEQDLLLLGLGLH